MDLLDIVLLSTFSRQLFKWFVQLCSDIVFIIDALGIKSKRSFSVSFLKGKKTHCLCSVFFANFLCECVCVWLCAEVQKRLDV